MIYVEVFRAFRDAVNYLKEGIMMTIFRCCLNLLVHHCASTVAVSLT